MSGAILETFVVSEILKSYWHQGRGVNLYCYRDRDGREIDLLIEQDNQLYPIEIKKTATPSRTVSRHFDDLGQLGRPLSSAAPWVMVPCSV